MNSGTVAEERQPFRRLDDGATLRRDHKASHGLPVSGDAESTTLSFARWEKYWTENGSSLPMNLFDKLVKPVAGNQPTSTSSASLAKGATALVF